MNSYFEYLEGKSRDELALDNIFSFMALHRRTIITRVEIERQENITEFLFITKIRCRTGAHIFLFHFTAMQKSEKLTDSLIQCVIHFMSLPLVIRYFSD